MSNFSRRDFLKGLLGSLVQATGVVIVASATASAAKAQENPTETPATPPRDVQERADQLAADANRSAEEEANPNEFLNGAFRNSPLGAFRNTPIGGFRNTPLGNFHNGPVGGFRNTPLGSFANGGWPNGVVGGFRNGGWPNVGWPNGVWRNGW